MLPSSSLSPFDADVEKATSATNTTHNWALIKKICKKAGASTVNSRDCLFSIVKRLNNNDPHVVLQAITLMDACISKSGEKFLLQVSTRDFEKDFFRLIVKPSAEIVHDSLKRMLKKWAENEFKSDSRLHIIPSLNAKIQKKKLEFAKMSGASSSKRVETKGVELLQGVDASKLCELSLSENEPTGQKKAIAESDKNVFLMNAKKLYNVIDAENQKSCDTVFELSDANHPEGPTIPATDLSSPKKTADPVNSEKSEKKHSAGDRESIEICEQKIDRLLQLFGEANPKDISTDTEEMSVLEAQVNTMGPMVEAQLEQLDKNSFQLTQLCTELLEAANLYNICLHDSVATFAPKPQPKPIQPAAMPQQHTIHPQLNTQIYNGMVGNNHGRMPVEHNVSGSQYPVNTGHAMSGSNIGGQMKEQMVYPMLNSSNNQVYSPSERIMLTE